MPQAKTYPFKFLDAYAKEDIDLFFGRTDEINTLYEMIFQTNILLVYGASGTGKTSLIQCGLASKFESYDWMAINIRRGTDLNESIEKALTNAAGPTSLASSRFDWLDEETGLVSSNPLERSFQAIHLRNFRPIYLIFDQFEELYILGDSEEQAQFIHTVKEILLVSQPVKIIISIREEYLAHLYAFEKAVPQLLRKKIRIEPMNLDKVSQVLTGISANERSLVRLKETEKETLVEGIFNKIKGEERTLTIQLTYLQVFLDKLYLSVTQDKNRQTEAILTMEALSKFVSIGDVLRDFLEEQVRAVSGQLSKTNTRASIDDIWKILSPFATLEGTKVPIALATIQQRLQQEYDGEIIEQVVLLLTGYRILRYSENQGLYEIAHDSLGAEIAKKRTPEQIKILESETIIRNKYGSRKSGIDYLTVQQIEYIRDVRSKLTITDEEQKFIDSSVRTARFRRISKNITIAGIILVLLLFSLYNFRQRMAADDAKKRAEISQRAADSANKRTTELYLNEENLRKKADAATTRANALKDSTLLIAENLRLEKEISHLHEAEAKKSAAEAQQSAVVALQSRIAAERSAAIADTNLLLAAQASNRAQKLNAAATSITLALQSTLTESKLEKTSLALQAFYLNDKSTNDTWVPEIAEALVKSNLPLSVRPLHRINSGILDIVKANGQLLLITDAGEIRRLDLVKDTTLILWKDMNFQYVNNSVYFADRSGKLYVGDRNKTTHIFDISPAGLKPGGIRKADYADSIQTNILQPYNGHYGSAFEISSKKEWIATGSRSGWLYVAKFGNPGVTLFNRQFQNQNTRINDISFDKDGQFIATGGTDSKVRLTKTNLLESRRPLEFTFPAWVTAISFLDNMQLLIGTADGGLYILTYNQDALAVECQKTLKGKEKELNSNKIYIDKAEFFNYINGR